MKEEHLSVEAMARWLSGDLSHEELLEKVVPHLVPKCQECRGAYDEVLRLQRLVDHWDERVAVFEGRQAPELLAELEPMSLDDQLITVKTEERYQTWGVCQLLLQRSFEACFDDPARAVTLAEVGVTVSEQLVEEAYDPHWILDLRAKALACLGNARRVLGEPWSAEAAFRRADALLEHSMTGNSQVEAEVLDLKASLRRDQRRFEESLELLASALAIYAELGDDHRRGRALVKKAKTFEEMGDLEGALAMLAAADGLVDPDREPRLVLCARHNQVWLLATAGRAAEAEALLPSVVELARAIGNPLDLVRLRWAEGRIHRGLGRRGPAEAAFREVQQDFLARRMGYDAALVSLDLALLYAEEGCAADLKRLAGEIVPIFESRDVHREAMAALLMFQYAAEEERLTAEMIRQLASFLRRERRSGA